MKQDETGRIPPEPVWIKKCGILERMPRFTFTCMLLITMLPLKAGTNIDLYIMDEKRNAMKQEEHVLKQQA